MPRAYYRMIKEIMLKYWKTIEKKSRKICLNNYIPIKKIPTVKFDLLSESDLKNRLNLKFIFILDLRFYVEEVLYKTRNPILANFQTKQIQVV